MPRPSPHSRSQAGFSLVFIAVLLSAASIILVSFLPGKEAGDVNQKQVSNIYKLQKVEEAMRAFMTAHGRRPCPADGQYAEGSANFGIEAANPGSCTGGTPAAPMGPNSTPKDCSTSTLGCIVGGVIPTKSLGLDDSYAFDEWGRRFSYVVDTRATTTNQCIALEGNVASPTGKGDLYIESSTGGTVLDQVMYAYISHGPDGHDRRSLGQLQWS